MTGKEFHKLFQVDSAFSMREGEGERERQSASEREGGRGKLREEIKK